MAHDLPADTRGIIDPATMAHYVNLTRYPAGDALDGLVEWFWAVRWAVPDGARHVQRVLNHPSGHLSIGTTDDAGATADRPQGRVYGLITRLSHRVLIGQGWTVAAKTTTGGLGALIGRPARQVTDRVLTLNDALGIDGAALVAAISATPDEPGRVDLLRRTVESVVAQADPRRLAHAREVARMARIAETDRSVLRVEHLAAAGAVSVRTLQRLFGEYVGASPAWVIRRWRIIEAAERAAEAVRAAEWAAEAAGTAVTGRGHAAWAGWAELAADLGYSDHAHLTRDVRAHLGVTPSAYLASQRP